MSPVVASKLEVREIMHLLTAARAGSAEAGFALGTAHEFGLGGLPVDTVSARRWYRRTACLSPRETSPCCRRQARDQTTLALYREELEPIYRRVYLEAQAADEYAASFGTAATSAPFRWYARRDIAACARAEFAMARLICLAPPCPKTSPAPWFRRAAEAGMPEAWLQLGLFLRERAQSSGSRCTGRRAREAFVHAEGGLRRLAKRGKPEAWYQLGVLLCEGWTGSATPGAGLSWIRRAAALGHPESTKLLKLAR